MKLTAAALLAILGTAASQAAPSPLNQLYGTAAYTYGPLKCDPDACDVTPSCNHAEFRTAIDAFNSDKSISDAAINIVYSYGGDIEFWPNPHTPHACWAPAQSPACNISVFFDPVNALAAKVYGEGPGVESVVALLDGRLDGWHQIETYNDYDGCKFGDFYPNLNNLTAAQSMKLAEDTAKLYCADDTLAALQIDLEPYNSHYSASLDMYVGNVATVMRDENSQYNCRNAKFPNGRATSYFTFAHSHSDDSFAKLLGDNGYFVFSAYDLRPKPEDGGFMYNNVTEFGEKMRWEINFMRPALGATGHFTLALPFAASCHEYEQYKPMHGNGCGPACTPETNTALMHEYVQMAFNVLLDPETTAKTGGLFCMDESKNSQFMGLSWWTWTHQMTYPPMKWFDNDFFPVTPSDKTLEILKTNLPKLSDGTTCVKPEHCEAATGRALGCACMRHYECATNNCDGTCMPEVRDHSKAPKAWTDMYGSSEAYAKGY